MSSAGQQQWEEIAAAIRAQLAKTAQLMPAMNPEEILSFINAVNEAHWLEIRAAAFDHAVEKHRQQLIRSAAYGG